jgi:hypothetical protein
VILIDALKIAIFSMLSQGFRKPNIATALDEFVTLIMPVLLIRDFAYQRGLGGTGHPTQRGEPPRNGRPVTGSDVCARTISIGKIKS